MRSQPPLGRVDAPVVVAAVFVAIAVALVAAIPPSLDRSSTEVLGQELQTVSLDRTGLRLETVIDLASLDPDQPFGDELDVEPPSMYQPVEDIQRWIDLPRVNVREVNRRRPAFGMSVIIRSHEAFDDLATTVDQVDPAADADVLDIAVTTATADAMAVALGDELLVSIDTTDPLPSAYPTRLVPIVLRIQRIVELTPSDDPVWFADDRLHLARRNDTPDGFEVEAVVAADASALTRTIWGELEGSLARRVDAVRLRNLPGSIAEAEGWSLELDRIAAASTGTPDVGETVIVTRLGLILDDIADARGRAIRLITSLLAGGVVLIALAANRLIQHTVGSRRQAIAVLRSRGASPRQLSRSAALDAAVGATSAVAGGLTAAQITLWSTTGGSLGWLRSIVIGATAIGSVTVAVGVLVWTRGRRDLGSELREERPTERSTQRVIDLLIIVAAIAGVVVVDQRGVRTTGSDWTAAAALAAAALATGVIARRALVLLAGFRQLGRLGLPTDLARRHLSEGTSLGSRLVDVVATAVVIIATATSLLQADHDQVIDQSWAATGAPVRVDAALARTLDEPTLQGIGGVGTIALESRLTSLLTVQESTPSRVEILAIDGAILDVTAADPRQPFGTTSLGGLLDDGSIPLLVPAEGIGRGPVDVGTIVRSVTQTDPLRFTVVGNHQLREPDEDVVVGDRGLLAAALGRDLEARSAWIDDAADLESLAAAEQVGRLRVRESVEAALDADPRRRVVRSGAWATAMAGSVVAVVTTLFGTLLIGRHRRPQSAILSAVGTDRRTVRNTIAIEASLGLVMALAVGCVGAGLVLRSLHPVIAPAGVTSLSLITPSFLTVLAGIAAAGAVMAMRAARRTRASDELRGGRG